MKFEFKNKGLDYVNISNILNHKVVKQLYLLTSKARANQWFL